MAKLSKPANADELKTLLHRLLTLLDTAETTDSPLDQKIPRYPCVIQPLPRASWTAAAARAVQINPANQPATHLLAMGGVGADIVSPEAIALLTSKYWGSGGVKLTVGFMEPIQQDLKDRILSHMNAWATYANVEFTFSTTEPQVRITRESGGYKSYLGTDILGIDASEPTMWLQGFAMETQDSEFYRVVRHETGHTLGFPHEHTRKEIVDMIDREKAISLFMRTQGWSRDEVIAQVLTPLAQSAITATAHADPNSIMCYALPGSIMKNGAAIPGGDDIDGDDGQFAAVMYPKTAAAPTTIRNYY